MIKHYKDKRGFVGWILKKFSPHAFVTVGEKLYIPINGWGLNGEDPYRNALLKHENIHSEDQLNYPWYKGGKWGWILRYLISGDFRWNAEKKAFEAQIDYFMTTNNPYGSRIKAVFLMKALNPVYRNMVFILDVKTWIEDVFKKYDK